MDICKKAEVIDLVKTNLTCNEFKGTHRSKETFFTRNRSLPFALVMVMILRKGIKSLQNMVNEVTTWLDINPVTGSAYSQARHKLKHTAFIALNERAIVEPMYRRGDHKTFWGFRLLAIDGSEIVLPDKENIREAFGTLNYKVGEISGEYVCAQASVMYDVLNKISIDAVLEKSDSYEVNLALNHLTHTTENDLLICDRNYPSYRWLSKLIHTKRHFVIRCSSASFSVARQMLKGEGADSQIVTITPCSNQLSTIKELKLPLSITLRFVRVRLSTGEYEVLVTDLLNEECYPTADFLVLYGMRWGIESFFGIMKTRLELENFTGESAESVRQDFYATVFLTGLETILTADAQEHLDAKKTKYPQSVNCAVSFNAIKNNALDLLLSDEDSSVITDKLTRLFLTNPTVFVNVVVA